jgi:ABC-type uncharacterized transport system ATPase subunit
MRCEIVASLIHNPKVLFLDEPTIGLDITAKATIRELIKKQTDEEGTTLLLTSHDTDDMEKVCDRVIIINKGNNINITYSVILQNPLCRHTRIRSTKNDDILFFHLIVFGVGKQKLN